MNLLVEPWCPVRIGAGPEERVSLPGLLHRLVSVDQLVLARLRPHQAPALHSFLVQLAFLALEDDDGPWPESEAAWRAALRGLTAGWSDDEPWQLVVDTLTCPAFLQPPAPAGSEPQYKREFGTPDELDILITSRNHEVKRVRMKAAEPADWVFALITLQTFEGYLGRNYGVVRMNSGTGSRAQFRLAPTRGAAPEFRRDLSRLRESVAGVWDQATACGVGTDPDPVRLVWLESWDGTDAWPLSRLHPLGVEICRRLRLSQTPNGLRAQGATSKCARIAAGESRGAVADPWLPLNLRGGDAAIKAFTASDDGLSYRTLSRVLFQPDEFRLPLLAQPGPEERRHPATLVAQVLVRGEGKTEGFHRREVRLPSTVLSRVAERDQVLATRSHAFVELAGAIHGKALRPALLQYLDGSDEPDWRNPQHGNLVEPFLKQAEKQADREFFAALARSFEEDLADDAAALMWGRVLAGHSEAVLDQALGTLPTRCSAPVLAAARARSRLHGALDRFVPGLRSPATPAKEASR